MKKSRRERRHLLTWAGEESINLTPLLDVIFNLIFFFLLATTLRQARAFVDIRLPHSSRAVEDQPEQNILVISITRDDVLYLDQKSLTEDELLESLRAAAPEKTEKVVVRGDAEARHQMVVKVLDLCAQAGHRNVSLEVLTEKP
ncbi:MAG TPA: biopolymer transporter ExbD [Candidatus Sumerlaeota bacterium]|nr:biopolymer transporter ExbD [Candidatus Sumerlaeota bacterium]